MVDFAAVLDVLRARGHVMLRFKQPKGQQADCPDDSPTAIPWRGLSLPAQPEAQTPILYRLAAEAGFALDGKPLYDFLQGNETFEARLVGFEKMLGGERINTILAEFHLGKERLAKNRPCPDCGTSLAAGRRLCGTCSARRRREANREAQRKWRKSHIEPNPTSVSS